jgi:hypothetical protein
VSTFSSAEGADLVVARGLFFRAVLVVRGRFELFFGMERLP